MKEEYKWKHLNKDTKKQDKSIGYAFMERFSDGLFKAIKHVNDRYQV